MTDLFRRDFQFDLSQRAAGDADPSIVPAVLSTDEPVKMDDLTEILDHSPESVDLSRFPLPVVENHSTNATAIAVAENPVLDGGVLRSMIRFGTQARAQEILRDVKAGIIRSLSVFYRRSEMKPEGPGTVRTTRWLPMHVSPVSTPADNGAGFFRSVPQVTPTAHAVTKEITMSDPATPATPVTPPQVPAAVSITNDGNEAVRSAVLKETREVAEMARSLKLDAADFAGLGKEAAKDAMIAALSKRDASPAPAVSVVSMTVDAADKARDAVTGALAFNAGFRNAKMQDGNPLVGRGIQSIIKKYAAMVGERSADWEKGDIAQYALGHPEKIAGRSAANVTSSMFPSFVFLNSITKIVAMGFERGARSATYRDITSSQTVPDFKQFSIGALGVGNLAKTAEDTAFPEIDKSEGVYNSTVKMWGGTMSLTLQALVNDDSSQFNRHLQQAGAIADKTIDRRTYQKLLMGTSASEGTSTWTSNTTSGGTIVFTTADTLAAARANVGKIQAALMNKLGLDGNPLGTIPSFMLVGPTNATNAAALFAPTGGQVSSPVLGPKVIASAWLEASALTGSSTTSYYMLADPNEVTGLVLSKIQGYENIQVDQYDAGAVAAVKYKLWLPFEVDLAYLTVGSTATVAAAQQATT